MDIVNQVIGSLPVQHVVGLCIIALLAGFKVSRIIWS